MTEAPYSDRYEKARVGYVLERSNEEAAQISWRPMHWTLSGMNAISDCVAGSNPSGEVSLDLAGSCQALSFCCCIMLAS